MADPDSRKGRAYHSPEILRWVEALHAPHDRFREAAFGAPEREGIPAIQVAPLEGRLLELLLRLAGARRVVEIGTLAGYSALWLARALPPDGHLWTLEKSAKHAALAKETFQEAGLSRRVTLLTGEALALLPRLSREGPFDAVFLDADKENYDAYGRWAAENLRPGGLLLADNAFFFGRLLEEDRGAQAVRRLHEESVRFFETVCVPTADGLLVGIRRDEEEAHVG
ncbi:MAG: O-methyltransferase [Acidobacteriota bacterium]